MSTPSKKLLRVTGNERVDIPDFEVLTRQTASWVASLLGTVVGQSAVVAGFDLTDADATTLRVIRNGGAFLAQLQGAAGSLYGSGTTIDSILQDDGGPTQIDQVMAGLPNDWYHVYVKIGVVQADNAPRVFWDAVGGVETESSINTRWALTWTVAVALHNAAAPTASCRIGTVDWDGALDPSKIYAAKTMLFEGCAVPAGSTALVPAPVNFAGPAHLADFDRANDRSVAGVKTLAQFANACLKAIEEIKDPFAGRWWEKPPRGLSIRAAQAVTLTVGQGTALSTGNYNAASVAGGYYDITAALQTIAADVNSGALPQPIRVVVKPGKYEVTAPVAFTAPIELVGAGRGATRTKLTGTGQIRFDAGSTTALVADMWIESALGTAALRYLTGMSLRVERCDTTGGAVLLQPVDAVSLSTGEIAIIDVISDGALRCETSGGSLRILGSVLGDVVAGLSVGVRAPRLEIVGSTVGGVKIQSSSKGVSIRASTFACLRVTGSLDRDIDVLGCRASGTATILGVAQLWRIHLDNLTSAYPGQITIADTVFVGKTGVSGVTASGAGATNLRGITVSRCSFVPDPPVPTQVGSDLAVWVEAGPAERCVVTDCVVTDYSSGAFGYVVVRGCTITKTIDGALDGTIFWRCPIVTGCTVRSALATCVNLANECEEIRECVFAVPAVTAAGTSWQIKLSDGYTTRQLLRGCIFPAFDANWGVFDGSVEIDACRFESWLALTLKNRQAQGLTLRDSLILDYLTVVTTGAWVALGQICAIRGTRVYGVATLDGQWATLEASDSTFENGLLGFNRSNASLGGTARVTNCVLWPRGDCGGPSSGLKTTGIPFPSLGPALTIKRSNTDGVPWYDAEVTGCEIKGKLDDALSDPGAGLDGVVVLDVGMHAALTDCTALLCFAGDAAVTTWRAILVRSRGATISRNRIMIDNVAGGDRGIDQLIRWEQSGFLDGNARLAGSCRVTIDDNQIESSPELNGANKALIRVALIQYMFGGVDNGETVMLSIRGNQIHMVTFDAATLLATTVAAGPIAQASAGGVCEGNVVRDRAANLAVIDATTVLVQKAGPVAIFQFGTNVVL